MRLATRSLRPIGRTAAIFVVLLIGCPAQAIASAAGEPRAGFWVSPHGDDDAPGTRGRPFATLERAGDTVRDVLPSRRNVRVFLLGGVHRLASPLRLDSRDSGTVDGDVVWRAAPRARPRISGAIRVDDWERHNRAQDIYRARLPSRAGGVRTRQLYVNGRRAVRARSLPYPEGFERATAGYTAPDDSLAGWRNPRRIEFVTNTQWKSMRCPVAGIRGRQITMREPCWTNVNVFPLLWSFQLVSSIENAYELLDRPGEWYLDEPRRWLYYIPRRGEDMSDVRVDLPVVERLIEGHGARGKPVAHIRFQGLTFSHATWLGPSGANGYASDQGGFHLTGRGHLPNSIGHDAETTRMPGNVSFRFGRSLRFRGNRFAHLGAVGLDLGTGSQRNKVVGNSFRDVSGAAIQLGGVTTADHHPRYAAQRTHGNLIANNLVHRAGREYYDAPGIALGYTKRSTVAHNEISNVPWSGIAIGWGWGLVDPGRFPGVPGAEQMTERQISQWGVYSTPTTSRRNRIVHNRIRDFLTKLWDGGAIYSVGQQGASNKGGMVMTGNVASRKRQAAGGNVFYGDGGSRHLTLRSNVSLANQPGTVDFGPCLSSGAEIEAEVDGEQIELCPFTGQIPYGSDRGGCRPRGQISFIGNYFEHPTYYLPCPYLGHPHGIVERGTKVVSGRQDVPEQVLRDAGLETRYRHLRGPR